MVLFKASLAPCIDPILLRYRALLPVPLGEQARPVGILILTEHLAFRVAELSVDSDADSLRNSNGGALLAINKITPFCRCRASWLDGRSSLRGRRRENLEGGGCGALSHLGLELFNCRVKLSNSFMLLRQLELEFTEVRFFLCELSLHLCNASRLSFQGPYPGAELLDLYFFLRKCCDATRRSYSVHLF